MEKLLKGYSILVILLGAILFVGLISLQATAQPNGATVTPGLTERASADAAGNASAYAGNLTELTITGFSITQSWQAFYGNVSGAIELADSTSNVFYNWSQVEPAGEIFASTNSTVTWGSIQCFNFTARGNLTAGTGGESAGGTNQNGTNLSQLETRFNIDSADVDGVNETFGFTINHDAFFVGSLQFSAGECVATSTFDSTGASVDNNFEEVLLFEPATGSVVFAAILEQGSLNGFDNADHDFQMIVLEDGHSGDVSATTYFFFLELD